MAESIIAIYDLFSFNSSSIISRFICASFPFNTSICSFVVSVFLAISSEKEAVPNF